MRIKMNVLDSRQQIEKSKCNKMCPLRELIKLINFQMDEGEKRLSKRGERGKKKEGERQREWEVKEGKGRSER